MSGTLCRANDCREHFLVVDGVYKITLGVFLKPLHEVVLRCACAVVHIAFTHDIENLQYLFGECALFDYSGKIIAEPFLKIVVHIKEQILLFGK